MIFFVDTWLHSVMDEFAKKHDIKEWNHSPWDFKYFDQDAWDEHLYSYIQRDNPPLIYEKYDQEKYATNEIDFPKDRPWRVAIINPFTDEHSFKEYREWNFGFLKKKKHAKGFCESLSNYVYKPA